MNISASSSYANIGGFYTAQGNGARNVSDTSKKADQDSKVRQLTQQEQNQVQNLKARDLEVRNHEQAHLNAASGIAVGGPSYSFTTGPDGKRYATGGEVSIDTSPVSGDPEATLQKAQTILRAALAPANPSSQDYNVAAKAAEMANAARIELLSVQQNGQTKGSRLDVRV